ncbi:hypothetical protein AB0H76_09380 [Nocardia sp. NPDC050712]|uniref:hypothetical protein n=1 Tax=Nocardia sp. NPDC050712 TaxID=3155518 RepID=UPI0033E7C27B
MAVTAVLAGITLAAPAASAEPADDFHPQLEKISPDGTISVRDDKDCFTASVKGSGFAPGKPGKIQVGTDIAMGTLRGDDVAFTADKDGNFGPVNLQPCGLTTHYSTEQNHTCTDEDLRPSSSSQWSEECEGHGKGAVVQSGQRHFATTVVISAVQYPWDDSCPTEDPGNGYGNSSSTASQPESDDKCATAPPINGYDDDSNSGTNDGGTSTGDNSGGGDDPTGGGSGSGSSGGPTGPKIEASVSWPLEVTAGRGKP